MIDELNPSLFSTEILTDDLTYTSPGERYFFKFSYLGNGIFFLKSKGYADEISINKQIQCGDLARARLAGFRSGLPFHLIWDISELKGTSVFARYQLMLKAGKNGEFGSISAVGANNLAKSFGKILTILLPNLNFNFCKSQVDAYNQLISSIQNPENTSNAYESIHEDDYYSRFIDLWQQNPQYLEINQATFKSLSSEQWQYTAGENMYQSSYTVIEGNTLLCRTEGSVKAVHIEKTYQLLENIISTLAYNKGRNRFYTIIDLRKVKSITLGARRLTKKYEDQYKDLAHMVIIIPSPIIHYALKVQKLINPSSFGHWTFCTSIEEAFELVRQHKKGAFSVHYLTHNRGPVIEQLSIPDSNHELKDLVKKLHQELSDLKKEQYKQIQRILEITGRMTWDESFSNNFRFSGDDNSPFSDIYSALSIVNDDFKEIIKEKSLHVQKLKESEDKYRNLINLATDIIVVYQNRQLKLVNSRVFNVIGYTSEEILRISPRTYIMPEEYLKIENIFGQRNDQAPWYFETSVIHKDGHKVHVSVSVGRITFENSPADMLIIRDITARKKADEELDKYHNHLEELVAERTKQLEKEILEREIAEKSDQLKSAFLSNMSHEIRTPMNAIIAFSDYLKDPELSASQREEYINYIQSSGQTLLTLINDIIDISKIEAKQIQVQSINCSVNMLLEELFILFKQHKKLKCNGNIELKLDKNFVEQNVVLFTDPYRLRQILSNLLDNALKFTERGQVSFGYNIGDGNITFYVKDTGIGIPEEKSEYIFERFGKIENSERNLGGTGLGLAISQNLAILMGGKLTLKSIVSEGSVFYLELPYKGDQQIPFMHTSGETIEKQSYQWIGKNILVAEDEELNYKVIEIGLKKTGANILRAKDGKEAVEIVSAIPDIHIILMDIQMPVMNGYDALLKIKQHNARVPVIAQTAFALMEERELCIKHGFNDYISKPISISELLAKIDYYFI